ncbi:MAG: hypothetical protein WCK29_00730 [archaeon]
MVLPMKSLQSSLEESFRVKVLPRPSEIDLKELRRPSEDLLLPVQKLSQSHLHAVIMAHYELMGFKYHPVGEVPGCLLFRSKKSAFAVETTPGLTNAKITSFELPALRY